MMLNHVERCLFSWAAVSRERLPSWQVDDWLQRPAKRQAQLRRCHQLNDPCGRNICVAWLCWYMQWICSEILLVQYRTWEVWMVWDLHQFTSHGEAMPWGRIQLHGIVSGAQSNCGAKRARTGTGWWIRWMWHGAYWQPVDERHFTKNMLPCGL